MTSITIKYCINCNIRLSSCFVLKTEDKVYSFCKNCYNYRICNWRDAESKKRTCNEISVDPLIKKTKRPLCQKHSDEFIKSCASKQCKYNPCKDKKCLFKH